jgi:hypothetical protein
MEKGVKVSGIVTGPDGTPMQGASVGGVPGNAPGGSLTGDTRFTVQTNAEGEFAGYLPAGNGISYHLCAYFLSDRPAPAANAVSEPFHSKPGDELVFKLQMARGAWLTGKLLDAQGKPVPGLKVSSTATDRLDVSYSDRVATTDQSGAFKLGPLRPGSYEVTVGTGQGVPIQKMAGIEPKRVEVLDGEEKSIGEWTLPSQTAATR